MAKDQKWDLPLQNNADLALAHTLFLEGFRRVILRASEKMAGVGIDDAPGFRTLKAKIQQGEGRSRSKTFSSENEKT